MTRSPLTGSIFALTALSSLALGMLSHANEIDAAPPGAKGLEGGDKRVPTPVMRAASDEPAKAIAAFRTPEGFKIGLWAAEPMLSNPVAISIDGQGRIFVAETHRYRSSTLDIRHYIFMLEDDLDNRTPEDFTAEIKRNFPNEWQKLGIESEVVRLLEDRSGGGKADFSSEYAAGMNSILDGVNAGVMVYDGKVWCTNIPNLWQFSGMSKEGKAEKRESLSSGYGVRFSFTGHDMHGLAHGPDGRLYFSFGDRGAHVKTKEGKTLAYPDQGAVFRCELDGTHMEEFAQGLRNPQELAFDNHGNLFTGDNDADIGDRERWVYLVEGSDSGWRIGWQHNPLGTKRDPWLAKKLWEPRKPGTPYYVLSPIMNIADGPCGVVHNPGTGLPAKFEDHFFVCSFKGSSARSGISMLRVKESGAGFTTVVPCTEFLGGAQATDIDFGPDSKMYFAEWGPGWDGTGRGRIFKMENEGALQEKASQVAEVKKLLGEGFKQRSSDQLLQLLSHPDQRIRLNSQWALAEKADAAEKFLAGTKAGVAPLGRIHAVWGLGHVARLAGYKSPAAEAKILTALVPLLSDKDDEVRAQVAKVLGEGKVESAFTPLNAALKDASLRVRFFAAQALGKFGKPEAAEPLLAMVRENADKDEFLRHAAVMALIGSTNTKAVEAAAQDPSAAVRLASLLVMRRQANPKIGKFLTDADPLLVSEAAIAINDEGIVGAYAALAQLITKPDPDEQLMLRIINANFREGTPATATALANFAGDESHPESLRFEILKLLPTWAKPFARDLVAGVFRPLTDRDAKPVVAAMQTVLPKLLVSGKPAIAIAAIDAIEEMKMKDQSSALFGLMGQGNINSKVRAKALEVLAVFNDAKLGEAIKLAFTDKDAALRIDATAVLAKINPDEAAKQLSAVFEASGVAEKKAVLTALGDIKSAGADSALAELVSKLIAGNIPGEAQLELLEAAKKRDAKVVKDKLAAYTASLSKTDPLASYLPSLVGGDKAAGEKLFKEHAVAECLRCHKIEGRGGDAGPDLTGVGARKDRHYILESIVVPGAQIADGFQSVLVTLKNGDMQAGVIKNETATGFTIQMPVAGAPAVTVKTADVKSRENAPSGMPPNFGDVLSKKEIRDLVEYVSSLKESPKKAGK